MKKANYGKKFMRLVSSLLASVLLFSAMMIGVSAETLGDDLVSTGANAWQIAKGQYEGNAPENKTTVSDDGFVRVQKNVVPTDVENEFEIYLSMDVMKKSVTSYSSITKILEEGADIFYTGSSSNGYPKKDTSFGPDNGSGLGNGTLNSGVSGSEKVLTHEDGEPTFMLQITYTDPETGKTYLVAEPKLQMSVPNSVVYIKVPKDASNPSAGYNYIVLENLRDNSGIYIGDKKNGGERKPEQLSDGSYVVPVNLTKAAYQALFSTIISEEIKEETAIILDEDGSANIVDPMGNYIIYDGFIDGDIVGTAPSAVTTTGTSVTWSLSPKDIAKVETTTPSVVEDDVTIEGENGESYTSKITTKTYWYLNVAEIHYKVKLDVTKSGFENGKAYPTNDTTTLNYTFTPLPTEEDSEPKPENRSVNFPIPEVKGTLYEFAFDKVDADTKAALSGATFTLTDANSKTWATTSGSSDGHWKFENLPWGTYTLTETAAPTGYVAPDPASWTLKIGYTEDLKDGTVDDHTHNDTAADVWIGNGASWQIPNTRKVTEVTITKEVTGNMGDPEKEFSFSVTSTEAMAEDAAYTLSADGKTVTFTLSDGQSVTLKGVKVGSTLTVTETGAEGYVQTIKLGETTLENGSYTIPLDNTSAIDIVVTNAKNITIDTGIALDSLPYVVILMVIAAVAVVIFLKKRKHLDEA